METIHSEHSKRVYQGVRVKHTVKDLLAEKRSRQTNVSFKYNTGTNSSQTPAYVQMSGSHVIPGYYGVRRPYLSDSELSHCHPSKQYTADVYSSSLSGKSLGCDPPGVSGYQPLFDPYFTETFGDYRTSTFPSMANSIFTPQAPPPLIPPFPNESSHFLLRDSWESVPDSVTQGEGLCDSLQQMQATVSNCQSSHDHGHSLPCLDSSSPTQYRSTNRSNNISSQSSQAYPLHPLEEMHFASSYQAASAYGCAPFMTVPSELAAKVVHLSPEESSDITTTSMHDVSSWGKEDTSNTWPLYEVRRTY
ncbi:POU domain class 2-associating factor 2-like [Chiloscyllium punctatum]|uniref:POU domain class 2-associating factor 2-like n=1 Tax=Chiloscyllium punctatum TaxID=137246 RepID=UPI003B637C76